MPELGQALVGDDPAARVVADRERTQLQPDRLGAQHEVVGRAEVGAQGQVLVGGLDA